MDETWLRNLVWTDYRLAVVFTVVLPIILLIWALLRQSDAILRLLIIYWRVASLLMVTVYLLIRPWPVGFISGFAARLLIPMSLWFWVDLNDEIKDLPPTSLKFALTSWRWAITIILVWVRSPHFLFFLVLFSLKRAFSESLLVEFG